MPSLVLHNADRIMTLRVLRHSLVRFEPHVAADEEELALEQSTGSVELRFTAELRFSNEP